jgi:hypothetical protein
VVRRSAGRGSLANRRMDHGPRILDHPIPDDQIPHFCSSSDGPVIRQTVILRRSRGGPGAREIPWLPPSARWLSPGRQQHVPKNARKSPENRSPPWQCFRILASLTRWHCVRGVRSGRELWGEWNHDETIVRGLVCGVSHPGRRRCGRCSAAGLTPGSETRRERTLTVTIEAIDPKVPSVRVKGPQGRGAHHGGERPETASDSRAGRHRRPDVLRIAAGQGRTAGHEVMAGIA